MRKLSYFLSIASIAILALTGCKKEDPSPINTTINNQTPNNNANVTYVVQVVVANESFGAGRTEGTNGIAVTLRTSDSTTLSGVTGSNGTIVFKGLQPGTVTGTVDGKIGFANIAFTADLSVDLAGGGATTANRTVSSIVTTFAKNASLSGFLYGDFSGKGNFPLIPSNPENWFTAPAGVDMQVNYTLGANYPMGTGAGKLTSVAMMQSTLTRNFKMITSNSFLFNKSLYATVPNVLNASLSMTPVSTTFTDLNGSNFNSRYGLDPADVNLSNLQLKSTGTSGNMVNALGDIVAIKL